MIKNRANQIDGLLDSNSKLKGMKHSMGKKSPKTYGDIGLIKDVRDKIQNTNWDDLRRNISFKYCEESDIRNMLGMPMEKKVTKEGLGGGGLANLRK